MKELAIIQNKLKAPKNQRSKGLNFSYRSCEDILEAVKPILAEQNCVVTLSDDIVLIGERYYVKATATLTNGKGESVSTQAFARETVARKGMDDSQLTGSSSSYARKYALNGLFCIDDTKDADYLNDSADNNQKGTDIALASALAELNQCTKREEAVAVWKKYPQLHSKTEFINKCKEVSK